MQQRTFKTEAGLKWRVYKFDNEDEYNTFLFDTEKYYKASTVIISNGRFRTQDQTIIDSIADDLAYKDLELKSSDLFVITKENTSLKISDNEKRERLIKRSASAENVKPSKEFTPEEIGLIWTDTEENVAKQLNKKIGAVKLQRQIFLSEHPGFVIPDVAKKKKVKSDKKAKNEWSEEQMKLLWSKPSMILSTEIGKTNREICSKRIEWCLANPNFVIPNIAQFNSKGLPNKVERRIRKDGWTSEQLNLLWEDSPKNLAEVIGKKVEAIYCMRNKFLQKNPDFVVPESAKGIKKKIVHPVEQVSKPIEKTELQPVLTEKETILPKEEVKSSMIDMADFINRLPQMPKKIRMNGIEIEF